MTVHFMAMSLPCRNSAGHRCRDGCSAPGLLVEDLLRSPGDPGRLLAGDDGEPVAVADDDVTRVDRDAPHGDGDPDAARAVLVRAGGGAGPREDRHADLAEGVGVARRAV